MGYLYWYDFVCVMDCFCGGILMSEQIGFPVCYMFRFDDEEYYVYSLERLPHNGEVLWAFDGTPVCVSEEEIGRFHSEYDKSYNEEWNRTEYRLFIR
jgi:hypothetical protein